MSKQKMRGPMGGGPMGGMGRGGEKAKDFKGSFGKLWFRCTGHGKRCAAGGNCGKGNQ